MKRTLKTILISALCGLGFWSGAQGEAGDPVDPSAFSATTVYRPGLTQAKFQGKATFFNNANGAPILVSNLLTQTTYELQKDNSGTIDLDHCYGALMAHYSAANASVVISNPWSGYKWSWSTEYTFFAYEGEIYLHSGDQVVATGRFDDGSAMVVDGVTLFKMGTTSGYNGGPSSHSVYTASADGWYPVNAWVWDWTGGKNICGSYLSGVQYNLTGTWSDFTSSSVWAKLNDPGNGSFLRAKTKETGFVGLGTYTMSGSDLVASIAFTNVPHEATLYAYYGDTDGETYSNRWSNVQQVATIAAGDTESTKYTVTDFGSAKMFAFCLVYSDADADGTDAPLSFENWTTAQQVAAEPSIKSFSATPGYTNATFAVNVPSIGFGVSSATMTIAVAYDADFTSPAREDYVKSLGGAFVDNVVLDLPWSNTTYYAKLTVANTGASVSSEVISFTTLLPTASVGSYIITTVGYDAISVGFTLTDYGDDSSSATVTVQASATDDFATLDSESDPLVLTGSGDLNVRKTVTAGNLAGNTTYYLRTKTVNAWGFVTYGEVKEVATSKSAVLTGIGYAYGSDGSLTASVDISALYTSPATITLSRNGVVVGTKEVTSAGTYDFALAGGAAELSVVVETSADSSTASISAKPGCSCIIASGTAAFSTARTALVVKPGDTILLPQIFGAACYKNLDEERFLATSGNEFTALDAGIAAIEEYNSEGALATTGIILIEPADTPAAGRVFVYDNTVNGNWTSSATWRQVGVAENADYPNATTDVVFIPVLKDMAVTIDADVTVQDILMGLPKRTSTNTLRLKAGTAADSTITVAGVSSGTKHRAGLVSFHSSAQDGTVNTTYGYSGYFRLCWGGSQTTYYLRLAAQDDVDFDFGGPVGTIYAAATKAHWTSFSIGGDERGSLDIASGATVSFVNGANYQHSVDDQGNQWASSFSLGSDGIRGGGTCRVKMVGLFSNFDYMLRSFEGTFVDAIRNNITQANSNRGGNLWSQKMAATNATMRLEGFVGDGLSFTKSVGTFCEGNTHGYGSGDSISANIIPQRGLEMAGGFFYMMGFNKGKTTYVLRPDGDYEAQNLTDKLTVDAGFSDIHNFYNAGTSCPIMHFCASNIVQKNDGMLYVADRRTYGNNTTARTETELVGFADNYVGYTGEEDATNDVFPIVPWCVTRINDDLRSLWWGHVGADNIMCRGGSLTSVALDAVTDSNRNVYSYDCSLAISEDKTVNSLFTRNYGKEKRLGEGRTLTITSGGLILAQNDCGIGTQAGGTANGSVVFPNRAYVYGAATSDSQPSMIWAPITAPKGMVVGYPGGHFVLGGDQTGIDSNIVLNAGTTYLGAKDGTGEIAIDVPVKMVGGNTKVVLSRAGVMKGLDFELQTAGGYSPKIEINAGVTEECRKLYVDGEALKRGTYGATGSGATNIDDEHFSGTGILKVCDDERSSSGLMLILR